VPDAAGRTTEQARSPRSEEVALTFNSETRARTRVTESLDDGALRALNLLADCCRG
jgi:hypothetical protein